MSGPDAFGSFGGFLEDDEVFGCAAGAVAHSDAAFVPGDEVDGFEGSAFGPFVDAGAEVEFVDPEEEVSAGAEDAVDGSDELTDDFGRHLGEGRAFLSAEDSFVPVSEFVEDAAVLGVEERGGDRGVGELGEKLEAVHGYALVCG